MRDAELREGLALVKQGIPFALVFGDEWIGPLSNDERVAFLVICGEIDGGVFDWNAGQWEKPK